MTKFNLFNFAALQIGWFMACYFSGIGYPLAGPAFTLVWLLIHFSIVPDKFIDLRIIIVAGLFGYLADSFLVLTGQFTFPDYAQAGMPTTIWMVTLWINFALTLRYCLSWLRRRYVLGMLGGAVFGPLAYFAGEKFSAIILADHTTALIAIGIEWIIAMLLLLWITEKSEIENGHIQQSIIKVFSR